MNKYIYLAAIIFLVFSITSIDAQKVISGTCIEGEGIYEYNSGATYTGEWKDGKRNGKGKVTYPKGVTEKNIGVGPVVLSIKAGRNKKIIHEAINGYIEESYIISDRYFDDDDYLLEISDVVAKEYGHDATTAKGYYKAGLNQIKMTSAYSKEAKLLATNRLKLNYLKSITKPNNDDALNAVRAYTEALKKKTEAEKFQAEADHIMLIAYQKLTNDVLSTIPLVDQALSIVTIATGEDLSGEPIPKAQRFFDYIMLIAPGSLKKMVENNPLNKALSGFMQKMNGLTMRQIEMLAIKCGISDEALIKVYKKLANEVYTDYPKTAKWLEDKVIGIPEGQIKGEVFKAIDNKFINDSTSVKTK